MSTGLAILDEPDANISKTEVIDAEGNRAEERAEVVVQLQSQNHEVRRHSKHATAKTLGNMAKAEFGQMPPDSVNEAIVRSFCLREAKVAGVRSCDLVGVVSWSVHYYWLPNQDQMDILGEQATNHYARANASLHTPGFQRAVRWLPTWFPGNKMQGF